MTLSLRAALAFAAALFIADAVQAAERTVRLDVTNVSCVTCAPIVRRTISRIPGVEAVTVTVTRGGNGQAVATVTYDDARVTPAALALASTRAGYPARVQARR
ncbi:mercury transporter [Brevundimonas sp.]|jgi:mercuric ion binding protein|uniref:heavy-metal-associated domain-containing protein n=1 Tax=Brevundimonas sp. TaxID=1871086 RepID=UPI00178D4EF4|nr:mercury transporter [Brevundimonas sp.]MBU3971112.1 mercury transporter [Alphaproteobacteria bacterium]MBA3048140.1 mercury transporter [Brevundimonas sp.]MBU3973784.1 mercury transporter [Alphaproteobacteria bacterium]MBU4040849.1 mercury transporter [Alphaproteobacteria bacterium]MBU4135405.1 mercury transporter [Alphaproteobacteria bacterium]